MLIYLKIIMPSIPVRIKLFSTLFFLTISVHAQVTKDSVEKKSIMKKAFREGMRFISTSPKDTVENEESINPYLEYSGKSIRNIYIEKIGFEKSIYDSAKKVQKTVTKVANFLHVNTREKIIQQHLFVGRNKPLNPYKLADNERFLRDKDFILDCRIVVTPVEGTDSVDLTVITRDVFSLGGTVGGTIPTATEFTIFDANLNGGGQRLEVTTLYDFEREPKAGYSFLYRKSSLLGSLTNLELEYNQLNDGRSYGREKEFAFLGRLSRPLVSPYTRMAGGLELSRNWSKNVYQKPDSNFLKYRYDIFDTWLGYNFGIHKAITNRNRHFLAVRYLNGNFIDQPEQPEYKVDKVYNNSEGYLSEFTFYRKDFYKTRYIFGFGRTEDIPNGISFGVTGGHIRQLKLGRPYAAIKFDYAEASRKGSFYRFQFQTGTYMRNKKLEDFVIQGGVSYFTRLLNLNRYKSRNYISATYTQMFNRTINDWLSVGKNQIPGFRIDSLDADVRLALHAESVLFTPWSIWGFRFAPFTAVDVVTVNCTNCIPRHDSFLGLSAGLRTRNENLIFGTMEMKFTYIPKDGSGDSKVSFGFKQNLRVKNSASFVKPPSLVLYN